MIKFHVFFALRNDGALTYAYDKTWKAVINAVIKDEPREKQKCPALVLNQFNDINGIVKNQYILLNHTTGWYSIDIDKVGKTSRFICKELFNTIEEFKMVWVSSSGNGVKAIGYDERLKNLTPEQYRVVYDKVCMDIRKRSGLKLNFDRACGRCHQPVFLNSDKKAFIR